MSDIKCPFCQQELKELYANGFSVGFRCKNKNCPETSIMCGTKALWQKLIRTRKALDIAVDALKLFDSGQYTSQPDSYGLKTDASRLARKTLNEITTTVEQKD